MKILVANLVAAFFIILSVIDSYVTSNKTYDLKKIIKIDNEKFESTQNWKQCNIYNCFDILMCEYRVEQKIGVYIYPPMDFVIEDIESNSSQIISTREMMSLEFEEFIDAIITSPYYESNPQKACVFVPNIDMFNLNRTLSILSKNGKSSEKILSLILTKLPYWTASDQKGQPGSNHLIVTMTRSNSNESVYFGQAILAAPFMDSWTYRQNFDIPIPFYSFKNNEDGRSQLFLPNATWSILTSQFDSIGSSLKKKLLTLENIMKGDLLILGTTCPQQKFLKSLPKVETSNDSINLNFRCTRDGIVEFVYPDILGQANFCLILPTTPKNHNLGHPIFVDSLASGCIPVIVTDEAILPLDWEINWSEIVVNIPSANLELLPKYLASIDDTQVQRRRQLCREVYATKFASMKIITSSILDKLNTILYP